MTVREYQGVVRAIRGDRQRMSGCPKGPTWVSQGISGGNQVRLGIPQWMSGNSPGIQGLPSRDVWV